MLEEIAEKYYLQGYNCSESILLAGNEYYNLGLDENSIRAFAGFGGGFQCGAVCGALSGAVGVISSKYVKTKAHDTDNLKPMVQRMVRQFQNETGGRDCAQVKPKLYSKEYKCRETVKAGARALEAVMKELENA